MSGIGGGEDLGFIDIVYTKGFEDLGLPISATNFLEVNGLNGSMVDM